MPPPIPEVQIALRAAHLDGWLFYDFRGSDPLAYRILQLDPCMHVTRRWYYWVPAAGDPVKLVHRIEPRVLDALPGARQMYVSWREQHEALARLLGGSRRIAMQYSPLNAIPYLSRVDAGTIELIRSFGVAVSSSADLVQHFEAVLRPEQVASHQQAATALRAIVHEAFGDMASSVAGGRTLTEYDVQQFILSRFNARGLVTSSPPIVAVDEHSADPHYAPQASESAAITRGALLLIDLWAKQPGPGSVYADITWTAYLGETVPEEHQHIFTIVRSARDTALAFVQEGARRGANPRGREVDDVCREVIRAAGYAQEFVHRTGHSIGEEVHGNGANLDNLETQDERQLLPGTCFSIEPGVYLPGRFGIRSECDVYLGERDASVYGQPLQTEIIPLLRP